jgi:hypothetical protein
MHRAAVACAVMRRLGGIAPLVVLLALAAAPVTAPS